ncbi:hypothetical protein BZARG_384 [Bizionia argentinensis JUB59]|uniref:Uncharacterized protein n=1 Tax=Bizionia argentinensis JUB59 TaxID=1046627 RepID=G2EGZ7_9FLAO|nr:hypothetical protein [Bizionia argentinensis]EGV42112.1 hypothetical protein BZARG_384 [Bizionia argentinensis JUB59]
MAVLAIWGTIGYKFMNGLSPSLPEIKSQDFTASFTPKANVEIDTFSIQNLERDPFLGTLQSKQRKSFKNTTQSTPNATDNSPKITYSGMVKKQNSSNSVFVININENQYLLKKGQKVDSVKLIRGNDKEISVRYKNTTQTIKRH